VKEGDEVRRTGKIMSVPASDDILGRVVNPWASPWTAVGPSARMSACPSNRSPPASSRESP